MVDERDRARARRVRERPGDRPWDLRRRRPIVASGPGDLVAIHRTTSRRPCSRAAPSQRGSSSTGRLRVCPVPSNSSRVDSKLSAPSPKSPRRGSMKPSCRANPTPCSRPSPDDVIAAALGLCLLARRALARPDPAERACRARHRRASLRRSLRGTRPPTTEGRELWRSAQGRRSAGEPDSVCSAPSSSLPTGRRRTRGLPTAWLSWASTVPAQPARRCRWRPPPPAVPWSWTTASARLTRRFGLTQYLFDHDYARRREPPFAEALELDPTLASAQHWMAMMFSALERHGEALELIDSAVAQAPSSSLLCNKRGTILRNADLRSPEPARAAGQGCRATHGPSDSQSARNGVARSSRRALGGCAEPAPSSAAAQRRPTCRTLTLLGYTAVRAGET